MPGSERDILQRPFGAQSRGEMLETYFSASEAVTPQNAWKHVYRLLLWIDRTTGLAHCYESDKAQPGRPWYARSLAFHDWVSKELGSAPTQLGKEVDWLFREGVVRMAKAAAKLEESRAAAVAEQRAPYEGRDFPVPGEDPELEDLILNELTPFLRESPPDEQLARLLLQIRRSITQENKRRNLVGEGFEDVLAAIIRRAPGGERLDVRTRPLLHELPGFRPPPSREKPRRVDLAVIVPGGRRTLATVKWSVRADREEQFAVDFDAYARLEERGQDFGFTLVSNEFDAARLVAACDRRRQNAYLFTEVVHVNPAGPLATYGRERRGAAARLDSLIESGRLTSLEEWVLKLSQ
jgi:hypothetical protein